MLPASFSECSQLKPTKLVRTHHDSSVRLALSKTQVLVSHSTSAGEGPPQLPREKLQAALLL